MDLVYRFQPLVKDSGELSLPVLSVCPEVTIDVLGLFLVFVIILSIFQLSIFHIIAREVP